LDQRDFKGFFCAATGFEPYDWQAQLGEGGLPDVLPVPTGLGKTEGVVLTWAWRRLVARCDENEPLHLVYCLPMRTLVRQTVERLRTCFSRLTGYGRSDVKVYELMGGAIDEEWARWPDKPWVLVGTQDQLLSRSLNRGYAMSRFAWPVHFGLLNQDCRWVIDEVQLMGPGLWATAQLDWMRRKRFASIKPCRTTWMSATVGTEFLATTDRKRDGLDSVVVLELNLDGDSNEELRRRHKAVRLVEWFGPNGRRPLHQQIAEHVTVNHQQGTLSLIVCNTVKMGRDVFRALPDTAPKILLTSRFRRKDREKHERRLLEFEELRRKHGGKPIPDHPGLICVSTQVVEAGLDVSAHQLWSELAPWPSVIQRLGRLNRDGRDQQAKAWFWETPRETGKKRQERIGPYDAEDLEWARKLVDALILLSEAPFAEAVDGLARRHADEVSKALQPKPEPMPRALDVHGLFSTERDVHGGFTDVSAYVRNSDPDADLTVYWREWSGEAPPRADDLKGPDVDLEGEGCSVPFFRLRHFLKTCKALAWVWNEDEERWERLRPDELRPGMAVMLHRAAGGYDPALGWTGEPDDKLVEVQPAGRGRALRDDARTETGYWSQLGLHLKDAGREAEALCDALGMQEPYRTAIIEAAGLHDIGKAHPLWGEALPATTLPATAVVPDRPWAKCPSVLAIDATADEKSIREAVRAVRAEALPLGTEPRRRGGERVVRLRWAVGRKLSIKELDTLRALPGVRWAGHVPFRPGLRHEAASALAMWQRYRKGTARYPALAVYLAAAHHGKVRTVLRSTSERGDDVFGVPRDSGLLAVSGELWPLDFTVAKDGAEGEWRDDGFVLTGHGWTGLVADLLGPWRANDPPDVGVVPDSEPRRLGPFILAYL
jgi:CRISPR-associated endonuclease/helicase Cas3